MTISLVYEDGVKAQFNSLEEAINQAAYDEVMQKRKALEVKQDGNKIAGTTDINKRVRELGTIN